MNIFQIITRSDTIGGAQKYVLDVSKELKKDGYEVTVVSSSSGVFKNKICDENINYVGIKTLTREFTLMNDLLTLIFLIRMIIKKRPDVVSLHSIKAGLLGRIACWFTCTTVYFTAHGWSHIRDSRGFKKALYITLEKYLSFLCKKVICVSQADLDFAKQIIGIKEQRLCLIPNGVRAVAKVDKKHSNDELKLLSIVRFQAPKDFDTLLLALSKIKNSAWILDILGDGPDFEKVKQEITKFGLKDKVNLLGFKSDIDEHYQNADAVILISKSEGLPMSLLEAMSCSKLLIASNVGGISELIIPEWNGFLIAGNDSKYLSSCIMEIINSPHIIKKYGRNSKIHFDTNYSFNQMYGRLLDLYKVKQE